MGLASGSSLVVKGLMLKMGARLHDFLRAILENTGLSIHDLVLPFIKREE